MKTSTINQNIQDAAKEHFEANCNDEASRNLVLSTYFAEEYDLTNDEATFMAEAFETSESEYFYRWYYFNYVNKSLIS